MYYKIENKESEVYKKLHELRSEELEMGKHNRKLLEEKITPEFTDLFGYSGQQNFNRVGEVLGVKFKDTEKVCLKTWKEQGKHEGVYVPNKRTKLGKEMSKFLSEGLSKSFYLRVFDILKLEQLYGRFCFPYVEIAEDLIIMYLNESQDPEDENIIEITKKEFHKILKECQN